MHARFLSLTTLVLASALAGCAVGPNYRRPEVEAPAKFRDQKGAQSPESLADLPWWRVFKDPVLQGLIREALQNNYDLRIAISRIDQARAAQMQARSAFFPQLGYQGSAQRGRGAGTTIPATETPPIAFDVAGTPVVIPGTKTPERDVAGTTANQFVGQGMASWEIDLWGRIRRSNEAALAQLLATEEAQRGVVQALVAQVAQTYFQLLELDEELRIARQATVSFGESLDLFTKQQRGGIASDLEVARGTAAQASAAAAIPVVERNIHAVENQLCLLLGRNPGPIPRGKTLLAQRMPPRVPSGIPADLLNRRPDIRQAEQNVVAANARIGVAVANFLPTVDLTAAAGAISPDLSKIANGNWGVWNVGGAINGPIFTGGLLYGQYKQAKAVREETILSYKKTAVNAFGEVADALISRQKYAEAKGQLERQVDALSTSVKLATDRYTVGISTYYEILEAQQQLFPAQRTLAQTRLNQLLAVVDLYKALGGGWEQNGQSSSKGAQNLQPSKPRKEAPATPERRRPALR